MTHLRITQAGVVSLAIAAIGQVIAFVPALAPDKQILISAVSGAIAAAFLIANAIHALIASKVSAADLEGAVPALVKAELAKVNLNALVKSALAGEDIGALVQNELQKILGRGLTGAAGAPVISAAHPAAPSTTLGGPSA